MPRRMIYQVTEREITMYPSSELNSGIHVGEGGVAAPAAPTVSRMKKGRLEYGTEYRCVMNLVKSSQRAKNNHAAQQWCCWCNRQRGVSVWCARELLVCTKRTVRCYDVLLLLLLLLIRRFCCYDT